MNISWDILVLLIFGLFAIYGMLIGRTKILGILVNLYVALAATLIAGDAVYNFVSNFQIISNNLTASSFGVKTVMMIVITALLTLKSEVAGLDSGDSLSTYQTGLYGVFTAGVLLAAAFSFMTYAQQMALGSTAVETVVAYRDILVAAPILWIIGSSFVKR